MRRMSFKYGCLLVASFASPEKHAARDVEHTRTVVRLFSLNTAGGLSTFPLPYLPQSWCERPAYHGKPSRHVIVCIVWAYHGREWRASFFVSVRADFLLEADMQCLQGAILAGKCTRLITSSLLLCNFSCHQCHTLLSAMRALPLSPTHQGTMWPKLALTSHHKRDGGWRASYPRRPVSDSASDGPALHLTCIHTTREGCMLPKTT